MNEKRCATCRHWQMRTHMTEGTCRQVLDISHNPGKFPVEMRDGEHVGHIVLRNAGGSVATHLSTGPQFGCIHWEVNDSGQGPMITEYGFGLDSLHAGSRHFKFSVPFEVATRKTAQDNWVSVDCTEVDIAASNPQEFAALFASKYDHIVGREDHELTPYGLQLKRRFVDDVTEEAQVPDMPDDYWSFGYAWSGESKAVEL